MPRSWHDIQEDTALQVDYAIWIEGLPYVFSNTSMVTSPLAFDGENYIVLPVLDLEPGLSISSSEWSPERGVGSSGSISVWLSNDYEDILIQLFRAVGAYRTYLDLDVAAADITLDVVDASGFPVPGVDPELAYLGRETVSYTGVAGNQLTGVTRGLYRTIPRSHIVDAESPVLPAYVATYPALIVGRWAAIIAIPRATGDPHTVYSGIIRECEQGQEGDGFQLTIDDALAGTRSTLQVPRHKGIFPQEDEGLWPVCDTSNSARLWVAGVQADVALTLANGLYPEHQVLTDLCQQIYLATSALDAKIKDCFWQVADYDPLVTIIYLRMQGAGLPTVTWELVPDTITPWNPTSNPGIDAVQFYPASTPTFQTGGANFYRAVRIYRPDMIGLSPTALQIPFYQLPETPAWPTSGYAMISSADDDHPEIEIVRYSDIQPCRVRDYDVMIIESVADRGVMGTNPQLWPLASEDAPEIRYVVPVEGANVAEFALILLASTGDGTNGAYDTEETGGAVPEWAIDTGSFTVDDGDILRVVFDGEEDVQLSDLLDQELLYRGYSLLSRMDSEGYRLSLAGYYQAGSATRELDTDVIAWGAEPIYQSMGIRCNRVQVSNRLLLGRDGDFDVPVIVNDLAGQQRLQKVETIEVSTKHVPPISVDEAIAEAGITAGRLFAWLGQVRFILHFGLLRNPGWLLSPGDRINITYPGVLQPDGTRGLLDAPAVVRRVTTHYVADGQPEQARIEAEYAPDLRLRRWSPTARVTAAGGGAIYTLSTDEFGDTERPDYSFFGLNYRVLVFQAGQLFAGAVTRTIIAINAATIELNAAIGWAPGADTYMIFQDYTTATTAQKHDSAWITDADGEIAVGIEGGKWA